MKALSRVAVVLSLLLAVSGGTLCHAQPVMFTDVTTTAGLNHYYDAPRVDIPRAPGATGNPSFHGLESLMAGAAAGDFNNDGWLDLFVLGGGLQPDALYLNNQDGTFTDQAEQWRLTARHVGSGVAVGDYNDDGWLDLFITSLGNPERVDVGQHRLYRNNGDGTFSNVAAAAGVNRTSPEVLDGYGAAFGDYDLDGDLDLYVTGWMNVQDNPRFIPSWGNRLFQNQGDGTFIDVSEAAGVLAPGAQGFSPCFADMNGDRFPELLLVADFKTSRYFANNGDGTFADRTAASGTGIDSNGMGTIVADFNNDGWLDWYVTSIFADVLSDRADNGNMLYYNQGNHAFTESGAAAGVNDGGWGWGTVAVDLNHDGWLDIVEVNGFLDAEEFSGERAKLWMNNGDATFTEMAAATGFDHALDGRGLLHFDYDNDGDQDLLVAAHKDALRLYRNEGPRGHWLRVFLDTDADPALAPHGVGSRVIARVGDKRYYRYLDGCAGYLSQSELSAHYGLGSAPVVDLLRIEWSNGMVTTLTDVAVNQTIRVAPLGATAIKGYSEAE